MADGDKVLHLSPGMGCCSVEPRQIRLFDGVARPQIVLCRLEPVAVLQIDCGGIALLGGPRRHPVSDSSRTPAAQADGPDACCWRGRRRGAAPVRRHRAGAVRAARATTTAPTAPRRGSVARLVLDQPWKALAGAFPEVQVLARPGASPRRCARTDSACWKPTMTALLVAGTAALGSIGVVTVPRLPTTFRPRLRRIDPPPAGTDAQAAPQIVAPAGGYRVASRSAQILAGWDDFHPRGAADAASAGRSCHCGTWFATEPADGLGKADQRLDAIGAGGSVQRSRVHRPDGISETFTRHAARLRPGRRGFRKSCAPIDRTLPAPPPHCSTSTLPWWRAVGGAPEAPTMLKHVGDGFPCREGCALTAASGCTSSLGRGASPPRQVSFDAVGINPRLPMQSSFPSGSGAHRATAPPPFSLTGRRCYLPYVP